MCRTVHSLPVITKASEKIIDTVKAHARSVRKGSLCLRNLSLEKRNLILQEIRAHLQKYQHDIYRANKQDLEHARALHIPEALVKQLVFDDANLREVSAMIDAVASLPDTLYASITKRELAPGLILTQRFVPRGVIAMICESRFDVLVHIVSLCVKNANGVLLKGASNITHTATVLTRLIQEASEKHTQRFVHLLHTREEESALTSLHDEVDLIMLHGRKAFATHIMHTSTVPVLVLGHTDGICHMYIHKDADLIMAERVLYDSKLQSYTACNAVECVLLHTKSVIFLPQLFKRLAHAGVCIHADTSEAAGILHAAGVPYTPATEDDWGKKYLEKEIAIKIVLSEEEAVSFINTYGSKHTDVIMTRSEKIARYFQQNVNSTSAFWNCSTRFSDRSIGLGAEVLESTSCISACGLVGIEGFFTTKWTLDGKGHTIAPCVDE